MGAFVSRCNLHIGDCIAQRYLIEEVVGKGTYGVVYKVKTENQHTYALKLLHLWDVHPEIRQALTDRFDMEFKTGKIRSPYLVQSVDHGFICGNPYIVMEYCPGGDVIKLMEKSEPDLVKIGRHVLYGLKELHRHGKVHRDLKPENVLMKADGDFVLTDFGISGDRNRRMTERNLFGKPKQIFGTYAYMPPEQIKPKRGDATILPTTDIFSFGVMMYQLITSVLPFGRLDNESDLVWYLKNGREGVWDRNKLKKRRQFACFEKIIEGCLVPDYKNRLQNAEEVLAFFPKTESPNPPIPEIDATSQKNLVNGALWRIMQGEEFGKIYKLNELLTRGKKFLTVGRNESDSSNSIEIQEQLSCYISRKHCTLEWDRKQKKWKIKDGQEDKQNENGWKPSTNGTFVNSREVSPGGMYIQPGDIITIGDTTIKVEIY